jgi:peptide/nickel transport system substrate-binding protein
VVLALTLALAASACSGAAEDDTATDPDAGDDTTDTTDTTDTADETSEDDEGAADTAAAGDQELTIVAAEPQSGLDTSIAVTQASLRLVELIFEPLLDYDENNELIPALAESWEVSDDGLSYDITLRENAMFSDGSPVTADDVRFSLERAAGEGAALESALSVMEGIEVVDERTVTVSLSEPSRVFLNAIATTGSAGILSQEAIEADPDYFTQPTATSGPWTLVSYTPQDRAVLQANEHYWNEGFPQIDTINYTFGSDTTAMAAALESGTVDMTYNMRPEDGIRLRDSGAISMYEAPSAGLIAWGLDKTQPPFDDVRVRQAVAYLVPRDARLEVCWSGIGPVSYGDLIYESSPLYREGEQRFNVDPEEALTTASALMDEAGWVMGDDGIRVADGVEGVEDGEPLAVTVPFENTWAQARCNTEMLQQTLLPLGVDVSPEAYDAATFWTDVGSGSFTMYHAGNSYATDDIHIADSYMCEGAVIDLMARWCNEDVDDLIRQAQQTSDIDEAADLYREVQDIVLDEQPIIVTGAQYAVIGTNPALEGYFTRADSSNRGLIQASLSE